MRCALLAAGALFAFPAAASNDAAGRDVYGVWLSAKQTSKIEIADCGDATPCGRIVWIDAPHPDQVLDDKNPDPALRAQPLLGLVILKGFEAKDDRWTKGRIYDPETGKSYGSKLHVREDGELEVKGCLGPICQTRLWTPSAL